MNIPALAWMCIFFFVPGALACGQMFLSTSVGGAIVGLLLTIFFWGMTLFFFLIARRQAVLDRYFYERPGVSRPQPRPAFKKPFLISMVLFTPFILLSILSYVFALHGIAIAVGVSVWIAWMNSMWQNTKHPMPSVR